MTGKCNKGYILLYSNQLSRQISGTYRDQLDRSRFFIKIHSHGKYQIIQAVSTIAKNKFEKCLTKCLSTARLLSW